MKKTNIKVREDTDRVGIIGLERLVEINRSNGVVVLMPKIDVYLELEPGAEADEHPFQDRVNDAIDKALASELGSIEEFCTKIIAFLHQGYPDAKGAEVAAEAGYVVMRRTPKTRLKTQEMYKILGRALKEDGNVRKMVGVEVTGISSCPCAHEGLLEESRTKLAEDFTDAEIIKILNTLPIASHNQRNVAQILLEVPDGHEDDIEAEDLILILEESMSSRLYEVLKREDEVAVVLDAHSNPNFVEDIVRKILMRIVKHYPRLPDAALVFTRSESFESIHQHNAIAERLARLGELRKEGMEK
ncbi:MAG: GTP cyclohydrolase MptA [Candidatus Hydrothermarchaeaceae archaeon]